MQENKLSQIIEGFKLWGKSKDSTMLPPKKEVYKTLYAFRNNFKEVETGRALEYLIGDIEHNVKKWYSSLLDIFASPKVIADLEKQRSPDDLIDLAKAVERYHRSRTQLKRDIDNGDIESYRKKPKGKHLISRTEADIIYLTKDSLAK